MPIIASTGLAVGGNAVSHGITELPKAMLDGYIDSPVASVAESALGFTATVMQPTITANGINITWADFIIMCVEGRASDIWERYDPQYFRDPYGRQFSNPRILDFTASYVEAVPGRTNFTMTLLLKN